MFGNLLRPNPEKKLRKRYDMKLYEAMQAQRNGNIRKYSALTSEAEEILKALQALQQTEQGNSAK